METEKIKKTITEKYIPGAFNQTDVSKFKEAFHPEFAIITIQKDGSFFLFTRYMWERALQERLNDPDFDYASIAFVPEFRTIDFVDSKASVTVDMVLNGRTIYTEFLLLHKINGEWNIVSKIFHQHQ